tara:strand:+ start:327 stop:872 length:546 start_codon:yes stop_codon:yes gene_type:complete
MAFWTDASSEPKRKFRFKVLIFDQEIAWYAKSVSAPSFEITTIEHHFSDHIFKYPGKIKWNDVTVTLVDPGGDDDVVNKTLALIQGAGYEVPDGPSEATSFDTFSKAELLDNNGGSVVLQALDQEGGKLEEWQLHNSFISSVKFGDFDYSSEDMREIEITFVYDWASCQMGTSGPTYFRDS